MPDWIITLIVLAIIVLVGFAIYTRRSRVRLTIPGASLEYEGDNDPPAARSAPGIDAKNIRARKGSVTADDSTGHGITATDIDAGRDVNLRASASADPKAPPPA